MLLLAEDFHRISGTAFLPFWYSEWRSAPELLNEIKQHEEQRASGEQRAVVCAAWLEGLALCRLSKYITLRVRKVTAISCMDAAKLLHEFLIRKCPWSINTTGKTNSVLEWDLLPTASGLEEKWLITSHKIVMQRICLATHHINTHW